MPIIIALRQKRVMKRVLNAVVLSRNKVASQLKTVNCEEEIDPWTTCTLINDAASGVREQYEKILQALLIEGYDSPCKEAPPKIDRGLKE